MPEDDRVTREDVAKRLAVAVADGTAVEHAGDGATDQSRERHPTREVERDDQIRTRKGKVEPLAVCRIEDPVLARADGLDPAALLVIRNLHPSRLPRQLVHGMPGKPRERRDAFRERCLARTGDPVDEDSVGHRASVARDWHPLERPTTAEEHVRIFRGRRDDEPVDPNERSPQLGIKYKDLAVLGQLMKNGADLTETRHVVYYSYAPSELVAQAMAREAETNGYEAATREPKPEFPGQWSVICEIHAVTSPEFVREADDFFQGLADRHAAEFDGWEASV